jgi:hypothetical protein
VTGTPPGTGAVFLWAAYSPGSNASRMEAGLPPLGVWQAAVGASIVGVALVASVILSYALTVQDFAGVMLGDAAGLVGDFRAIVITVVG